MPGEYDDLIPDQPLRADIRQRESGGRDLPPEANYAYPRSHANSDYQIQPDTWKGWTKEFGVGQEYPLAYQAPAGVRDAVAAMALKKYGPNSSATWQASGPYKEKPQAMKGEYDDLIPKAAPGKTAGTYDDLIPKQAQWRVPPANEGPRAGPAGPIDPSIQARQKLAPAIAAVKAQNAQDQLRRDLGLPSIGQERAKIAAGDPEIQARIKQLPPQTVAAMMRDPQNPMWLRITGGVAGAAADAAAPFTNLPQLAKRAGAETSANTATPETAGDMAQLALQTALREAPGRAAKGIAPEAAAETKPASQISDSLTARAVGADVPAALQRPVHEIALENMKRFQEENPTPGFKDQLKGAAKEMRTYFDTQDAAKAIIQRAKGNATQMSFQARAAMEKFRAFTGTLSPEEQVSAIELLESGDVRKGYLEGMPKESQDFLNTFRDWMRTYQRKIESLPQGENLKFKEDFVTHLWQRPKDMLNFIHQYGSRTGSNYFTKKRTFESFGDGVRAGLAPITTNPVELFARYVENASAKIGTWEAFNDAKDAGFVVFRKPGNQPDKWQELTGQNDVFGQKAYAPAGFASVWNTYFNRPQPSAMRNALDYIHQGANKLTAFRLGFSAVHSGLVTFDAIASGVGNAITKTMWGSPLKGYLELSKSLAKPFTSTANAKEAFRTYLDASYGDPSTRKLVQGLVDANFDFLHEGKAADEFRATKIPGLLKLIERGNLKQSLGNEVADVGKIRSVIRNGVRLATITGEAQFQYYVPWMKTQTAMDLMKTYLDANPAATRGDLATYARKISNRVDARFGEMNKDNIFWSQTAKKLASIAFLSYSFTYGGLRQIASGVGGIGGLPLRVGMKMAGKLHPTRPVWDDAASYVIGVAVTYAAINAMYEYLKTGTAPHSGQDLLHPRTGGQVMAAGKMVPERASSTNVANTFLNLMSSPGEEFYNKLNPMVKSVYELATNKDWSGAPIRNSLAPWQRQAQDVANYIFSDAMQPIQYTQFEQKKKGSNISLPENMVGVRTSGSKITNPEAVGKAVDYNLATEMYEKYRREDNARRAQAGRTPAYVPHRMKQLDIQHIIRDPSYNPFDKAPAYGGAQ